MSPETSRAPTESAPIEIGRTRCGIFPGSSVSASPRPSRFSTPSGSRSTRPAPSPSRTMTRLAKAKPPAALRRMTRILSLAAAGLFSLVILLDPYLLAGVPSWRLHTGLQIGIEQDDQAEQ